MGTCLKFVQTSCSMIFRIQLLGYHSVMRLSIGGFIVVCLLYEDEHAARRLDMGLEVCSNFMFPFFSELKVWATIPSWVCPLTDSSCCFSYMKRSTLHAGW